MRITRNMTMLSYVSGKEESLNAILGTHVKKRNDDDALTHKTTELDAMYSLFYTETGKERSGGLMYDCFFEPNSDYAHGEAFAYLRKAWRTGKFLVRKHRSAMTNKHAKSRLVINLGVPVGMVSTKFNVDTRDVR